MFYSAVFNRDISNWDVSNVIRMGIIFCNSDFNQDISNWNINPECDTDSMFKKCYIRDEYKPKKL
jgi:surface protein